jgi:acetyltransferase-like isoleucine patch superfamily enzyme
MALPDYITIGEHTYFADLTLHRWGNETVKIGRYCAMSQKVSLLAGGNHRTDVVSAYPFDSKFRIAAGVEDRSYGVGQTGIEIGNDVWVGYGASIIGTVKVGDGAVIAAQAVVFTDVPPYGIAVGNPAKVLKFRFNDDVIEKLLALKWWDWSDEVVKERLNDFYLPVGEFISKYASEAMAVPVWA